MFKKVLRFFLRRSRNKLDIQCKVNSITASGKEMSNLEKDLLACNPANLKAMQTSIRMKEAAENQNAGFVGGFVSPDGKIFMVSTENAERWQVNNVRYRLKLMEQNVKKSNEE